MKSFKEISRNLVDFEEMLDAAISSDLDPSIFEFDVDVPRAKNVIDFVGNSEFLNLVKPDGSCALWAKQAELAVKLFADYCTECSDVEYIGNVPVRDSVETMLTHIQLLEHGICPRCGKNRKELYKVIPWEIVSCMGQRSGKSVFTSCVVWPYQLHRFITLKGSPAKYFGMLESTPLIMTFTAIAMHQVYESCWAPFYSTLSNSPWFNEYHKKLRGEEKRRKLKPGSIIKINDTFISYQNKNITVGFRAADGKTLRGRTRFACSIDELGWFDANNKEAKKINADETYAGLNNSLETVRQFATHLWDNGDYDVPFGLMINISSPCSKFDKIMQLLKDGEVDDRKLCAHLASWEASPIFKRENFRNLEITQPKIFLRDFAAIPPLANEPWMDNEKFVYDCRTDVKPIFEFSKVYVDDALSNNKYVAAKLISSTSDKNTPRIVTVDAGETNNNFAVCVYSLHESKHEDGQPRYIVTLDGAVSACPEEDPKTRTVVPIHFPTMFNIIEDICAKSNILYVVYDRWQSTGEIHRLRDKGIKAERYSPVHSDFVDLKGIITSGNLKTPNWEVNKLEDVPLNNKIELWNYTYSHFALQMATVREIGKKVTKPTVGDDDMFRTLVLATKYMFSKLKEFVHKGGPRSSSGGNKKVGVVRQRSSGSSGGSYRGSGSGVGVIRRKR